MVASMAMNQALLQEFDAESATTRKALTSVPDNKLGWKPHARNSASIYESTIFRCR